MAVETQVRAPDFLEDPSFKNVASVLKAKKPFFVAVDLSKHRGKYVAIVGKRIVSSGRDANNVWLVAKKKYPRKQPELLKVSKDATLELNRW